MHSTFHYKTWLLREETMCFSFQIFFNNLPLNTDCIVNSYIIWIFSKYWVIINFFWGVTNNAFKIISTLESIQMQIYFKYINKPFLFQSDKQNLKVKIIILHPLRWFESTMPIYRKAFSLYQRIHLKIYIDLLISVTQFQFESIVIDQSLETDSEEYWGIPYWTFPSVPVPMDHNLVLEMPAKYSGQKQRQDYFCFCFCFFMYEARINSLNFIDSFMRYLLSTCHFLIWKIGSYILNPSFYLALNHPFPKIIQGGNIKNRTWISHFPVIVFMHMPPCCPLGPFHVFPDFLMI